MNKTGFFFHGDCSLHEMGTGHPECPQRLAAVEKRLQSQGLADKLMRREAPLAPITDLKLAHSRMYVASLRGLTDRLRDEVLAGGPTHAQIDPDTSLNIYSYEAALCAAVAAVDAVMGGGWTTRFATCVPPATMPVMTKAWGFA